MKEREFRVLIVEDDRTSADLLRWCLARRGMVADVAVDGNEAIDRCRRERWDAIVLDLLIPGANGFEVMRELGHFRPDLLKHTIVVTGAGHGTLSSFDTSKVRSLMRKPVNLDALVSELEECRHRRGGTTAASPITPRKAAVAVFEH